MPIDDASNKIQVEFTPEFKRNIRHLSKKYRYYSATETTEVTEEDLGVSTTSWRAFRALYPCICDLIRNFFMSLCSLCKI